MEKIKGFKAFEKGLVNRYGFKYELCKNYHVDGEIKFKKNGFHFCKNLEDTLRYVDGFSDIDIALVTGFGVLDEYEDTYYDYYEMFASSDIVIEKILDREEIINYYLNEVKNSFRIIRFISMYKLKSDEIEMFINKFQNKFNIDFYIDYFQYQKRENAYVRKKL